MSKQEKSSKDALKSHSHLHSFQNIQRPSVTRTNEVSETIFKYAQTNFDSYTERRLFSLFFMPCLWRLCLFLELIYWFS